ncbi:MAG TPA: carboxypeptidase-like regulatory domain-containing protein [Pyrinomonadaceae bacterium]
MTEPQVTRIADCRLLVGKLCVLKSAIKSLLCLCLLITFINRASGQESAPAPAPEIPLKSSSTGTITGRVTGDDGRPISDAVVNVFSVYSRTPGTPQTAITDGEGKFQVTNLPPGLYGVNAMYPSFVTAPSQNFSSDPREGVFYRLGDYVDLKLVKGGVITGIVRDVNNDPVVAVSVRATLVRDAQGRAPRVSGFSQPRMTDDRGVFRLYGLQPGTYLVSAGGNLPFYGMFNPYEGDAATYYPSATTRDTASEVSVRSGDEAANIDIRYRGERGHTISGTITGMKDSGSLSGASVSLRHASSGGFESTTFIPPTGKPGFAFNSMADGEYEVAAQQGSSTGELFASIPRRITVKGADVSGLEIALVPLASVEGRVALDPAPKKENCAEGRRGTLLETLVSARRAEKLEPREMAFTYFNASGAIPTDQGDFAMRNLQAGNYRLTTRLPGDAWYVRSITLPAANTQATAKPASAPPSPILTLKAGERVTGVTVQIAQDAAALRGRIVPATEGAALPANLRVYLVPAERERAEDVLRYGEAFVDSLGTFSLNNLAPGRYLLVARPEPENQSQERDTRPLYWDAEARSRLRREAEAANNAVELQPCQRNNDYVLRHASAKP